jgi:RNA polymerase sigma-70 factor, ECF subfamily
VRARGLEGRSRLQTWTLSIVINIARRRAQRDGRITPLASFDDDAGPTVDPRRFRPAGDRWAGGWTERGAPKAWNPETVVLTGEILSLLRDGLEELPERQRAVVALRDVYGLTPDEACAVLELTTANQRVLLHRGRARRRRLLEDYYHPAGSE